MTKGKTLEKKQEEEVSPTGEGSESKEDVSKDEKSEPKEEKKEIVKKGNLKEESKDTSIEILFEVISRLRLTLDKNVSITFGSSTAPLSSLKGKGSYPIKVIDEIPKHLIVWRDDVNDQRYLIDSCSDSVRFCDVPSFISAVIQDFRIELGLSMSVLREPPRISIYQNDRCYDPDRMGFPMADTVRGGLVDDGLRMALNGILQGQHRDGLPSFSSSRVFDYTPRAKVRENLLEYAINHGQILLNQRRNVVRMHNRALGLQEPDIRYLNAFETVNPTYPPNAFYGLLDAMPKASYVARYEMVTNISGFSASLKPIPSGEIMKSAGANVVKASWLSDIVSISYHDEMAPEIAAYFSSLVTPGQILLEVDFSDFSESSIEMRGIAAIGAYLLMLFNSDTTFVNMSRNSIEDMQRAIVRLGVHYNVFKQTDTRGEWPLDNVQYGRTPVNDLDGFRVIDGNAGINQDGLWYAADELSEVFLGVGRRINYATNYDDYQKYKREIHGPDMWGVYQAIQNFLRKIKNLGYLSTFFSIVAMNMLDFYVRINEHNKTRWYSAFRDAAAVQNSRNLEEAQKYAIKSPIKGKTIIYLIRSLSGAALHPNCPFTDVLDYSSGGIRVMCEFAMERLIVDRLINELGIDKEFSPTDRLALLDSKESLITYLFSIGKYFNEIKHISSMWLHQFVGHDLSECFEPLHRRRIPDLITKGVLPKIVSHLKVNGFTKELIEGHIMNRTLYVNSYNGPCVEIDARHLLRIIEERSYNYTLYQSIADPVVIHIPVPFDISHDMSVDVESHCLKVSSDSYLSSVKDRIKIDSFKLYMITFDNRKYHCLDDYTPKPVTVQANFAFPNDVTKVYYTLEDFFANLGQHAILATLLCNDRHSFVGV